MHESIGNVYDFTLAYAVIRKLGMPNSNTVVVIRVNSAFNEWQIGQYD